MDYFVIEMVSALRASSAVASARAKKLEQDMMEAGLMPAPSHVPPTLKDTHRDSVGSTTSKASGGKTALDDEEEAVRSRLEAIGMHVGANVAERYVSRYSMRTKLAKLLNARRLCHDRGMFSDTLDAVKFVCKDLWVACWDKQVDNLRTNHRVCIVCICRFAHSSTEALRVSMCFKTTLSVPLPAYLVGEAVQMQRGKRD